jgi:hypothetical protein
MMNPRIYESSSNYSFDIHYTSLISVDDDGVEFQYCTLWLIR